MYIWAGLEQRSVIIRRDIRFKKAKHTSLMTYKLVTGDGLFVVVTDNTFDINTCVGESSPTHALTTESVVWLVYLVLLIIIECISD